MTVVPNIQHTEKWINHFRHMGNGHCRPEKGLFHLRKADNQVGGGPEKNLKIVTPTAQAVEMAKADIEREKRENKELAISSPLKRKLTYKPRNSPRKHRRKKTSAKKKQGKGRKDRKGGKNGTKKKGTVKKKRGKGKKIRSGRKRKGSVKRKIQGFKRKDILGLY